MPGDPYLSWEHLLDEDEDEEAPGDAPAGDAPRPDALPALPPRLQQLADERDVLEQELRRLTGTAEPDAEEQRLQRMFPVQVHTNATRIEERRLRRHDEAIRLQQQRRVEQRRIAVRIAQQHAQQAAQARQEAADAQRLRERWVHERQQALSEATRKRAWEASWHARRDRLHAFRAGRENDASARPDGAAPAVPDPRLRELARQRTQARLDEQRAFDDARERQRQAALDQAAARSEAQRALERRDAQRGHADARRDAMRSAGRSSPTASIPSSPARKRRA